MATRRDLLRGLSGVGAWLTVGRSAAATTKAWDLIVVGAGTAGLPTGLFAATRGLRVLLLEVDDALRVLTERGDPVAGLYAVGELLGNGSLSGQAFCSGMMVTPALSLGRWLGLTLA